MNCDIFYSLQRVFVIFSLLLISACTSYGLSNDRKQDNQKTDSPIPLIGTQWQLERYWFEDDWVSNLETERISIVFLENHHLNGFSGCNAFSAGYKLKDDRLVIQSILSTRKYCQSRGNIVMHTEGVFLRLLESVTSFVINQNTLILSNKTGKKILIFMKK